MMLVVVSDCNFYAHEVSYLLDPFVYDVHAVMLVVVSGSNFYTQVSYLLGQLVCMFML